MAVEEIRSAIGEDGIKVAVEALKEIASDRNALEQTRVQAAQILLSYGLSSYDASGNPQTR